MAGSWVPFGGVSPSCRLMVLALLVLAAPAFASVVDLDAAERLGQANAPTILAAIALAELGAIIYLFLALQRAQAKHHAETVETLTSVVMLSVKSADGLQVLEKAIDLFTQERKR